MTGFSPVGRAVALRISDFVSSVTAKISHSTRTGTVSRWFDAEMHQMEVRLGINFTRLWRRPAPVVRAGAGAVAIVERHDGFYALFSDGELRGPVSPNAADDLPVLSGPHVDGSRGGELIDDAAAMVRAEAQLSHLISEMKINDDGTATLYLQGGRMSVTVDLDAMPLELGRVTEIRERWHDHEQMIDAIDMTTPGEAVVRIAEINTAPRGHVSKASNSIVPSSRGGVRGVEKR